MKRPEIYEEWYKRCRDFMLWYDGYVKSAGTAIHKLINLFGELEELTFGERMTISWI
jgi:hypothetical protein